MLQKSSELAYWLGIVQTDACYNEYTDKSNGKIKYRIVMEVTKSLPMLEKFSELSQKLFSRKAKICKKKKGSYEAKIYIKEYLSDFSELNMSFSNISKIPNWITESMEYFGAYLAGVIDGDGSASTRRPKYPQCFVRITNGIEPTELRKHIINNFNCGASIRFERGKSILNGREINGEWYTLEFCVSSKNYKLVNDYVLPWIVMPHKKDKIQTFLKSRSYIKPRVGS